MRFVCIRDVYEQGALQSSRANLAGSKTLRTLGVLFITLHEKSTFNRQINNAIDCAVSARRFQVGETGKNVRTIDCHGAYFDPSLTTDLTTSTPADMTAHL